MRQEQGRRYLPIRKDTNAFRLAYGWYNNTPPPQKKNKRENKRMTLSICLKTKYSLAEDMQMLNISLLENIFLSIND